MATQKRDRFVKSADTRTPVANSRAELEKMLTRYGCSRFAVQTDYEQRSAVVSFVVPDSLDKDAAKIPVRLEVQTQRVYDALYGRPTKYGKISEDRYGTAYDPAGYRDKELAQAERVAWRQLILWVDAALSAAASGVQKISEAFLAHTLIRGHDGVVRRMVDHMDLAAGGNWKALLPAPRQDDE